jgi:hypothetical protein
VALAELIGEAHEGCAVAGKGSGGRQTGSSLGQRLAWVMHGDPRPNNRRRTAATSSASIPIRRASTFTHS